MAARATTARKEYSKFTRKVANELYRRFGDVLQEMSTFEAGAFYACLQDGLLNPGEVIQSTLRKAKGEMSREREGKAG